MNELTGILQQASARVGQAYFRVNIAGGDPIYRERVYCYELYHQMRVHWPDCTPFYLNGELDKRAHPILRTLGADYATPDLLVHQPGAMAGNHAIIEAKSSKAPVCGIRKDLRTLSLFVSQVQYQRAIYLIYGHRALAVARRVRRIAGQLQGLPPIELWLHTVAGEPATHHSTLR